MVENAENKEIKKELVEKTALLSSIAEIVYGINAMDYDKEIREIAFSDSHWHNHVCLKLKKINGNYFNDPYYEVENYDVEPFTKKDGGPYPDGTILNTYKTTMAFNRSFHDHFPQREDSFVFNEHLLAKEIERNQNLLKKAFNCD